MNSNNYNNSRYPSQKLPRSKKTKDWGKQSLDYIIGISSFSSKGNNHLDHDRMRINYNLYNNIINKDEFTYVTRPYGISEELPARLENFNIITPKLKLLEGEEMRRAFNFRAVAVNSEAVSEIENKRRDLLLKYLESELEKSLMERGINIQNPETGEVMTPEQIEKYMNFSESDIREITANNLSNYIIKRENLEFKFNKGFKDALIASKEIYYTGIESNEPICEVVNPLDFDYDKDPDIDFIQDSQWAAHTKYCTPSQIIDYFYKDLTAEEVAKIDAGELYGIGYKSSLPERPAIDVVPTTYSGDFGLDRSNDKTGYIRVVRCEWKSLRKIGYLKYYDENLEEQSKIVDETYIAQKDLGEEVEWVWINEVWEGTKIGDDIYVRIRPKTVQYRTMDNPSICKLGYVGVVYNDRNSIPTSIMDLVKRHQYLYNIIMYRMELEIAKAKGKKMVMDIAQIPRSQGIDMEKWLYYFDTMGLAFINSFEEGKGNLGKGMVSSFNQFSNIDMTLSQSVGQYLGILSKIEEMTAELMGVSKQRLGSISSSETVGGVERSVMQSSSITEPLFYMHNEVKKHVLTQLVECAKFAYPLGKKISFILDDAQRIFLEINDEFVNADYGIFMTNSAKEVKSLEDLRSIAQQALSAGIMGFDELVTMFDSNSMAEIKGSVKRAVKKQQADKEREYQAQQEQVQAQNQGLLEQQKANQEWQANENALDREAKIEEAYIKTFGGKNASPADDADANGIPDIVEYDRLSEDARQHDDKMSLDREKLKVEREKMASDQAIAKEKVAVDRIKANKPTSSSK